MTSSINELEKQERWSEAGYGKIFAYQSLHFNAVIDTRTKAKYIRERNPTTYQELNETLYSGPTVFVDRRVDFKDYEIMKADLKSAYPSYLINAKIRKPGVARVKVKGAVPLSEWITLYTFAFKCHIDNMFVKWFLNSSSINKKKISTDGNYIWGKISIFSNVEMNLMKYVDMFLGDKAIIESSIMFVGHETMNPDKLQIRKLYKLKEQGVETAKTELNASTGWLSRIDKPTYYHMIQYIKYFLLETAYNYGLQYDIIGVQTDCLIYRLNENTEDFERLIKMDKVTLSNEQSTMGTYKFTKLKPHQLFASQRRIIVDEKETR